MPAKLILSLTLIVGAFAQAKPNLIFIMAEISVTGISDASTKTDQDPASRPNGQRRNEVHPVLLGSTVCAPSRSVLMTGQHMGHTHVRGNAGGDMTRQSFAARISQ